MVSLLSLSCGWFGTTWVYNMSAKYKVLSVNVCALVTENLPAFEILALRLIDNLTFDV